MQAAPTGPPWFGTPVSLGQGMTRTFCGVLMCSGRRQWAGVTGVVGWKEAQWNQACREMRRICGPVICDPL